MTEQYLSFLGAQPDVPSASAVILGCPYEDPGAFRRGAETAPFALREFSRHISSYHPQSKTDLRDIVLADRGDLDVTGRSEEEVFAMLEKTASSFFHDKRFLLTIGGSRAITYPLIKAAKSVWPRLRVLSLDAHTCRETKGEYVSHDNLFSALLKDEIIREKDLYQWGCRVGSKKAMEDAGIRHLTIPPKVKKDAMEDLHRLYKYPVYLTIDMDVMDPPFAPGSGHPVYGGIGTSELLETVSLLRGLRIVGMDITEIVPCFDHSGITTILGTALVKEALICYGKKER